MKDLHTDNLQISYDKRIIVDGLDIAIPANKITALVGAKWLREIDYFKNDVPLNET